MTQQIQHIRTSEKGNQFIAGGSIIKDYLNQILSMNLGGKQKAFYSWVLQNGRSFGALKHISDEKTNKMLSTYRYSGTAKQCFYNAQLSSLNSPLQYYEGWYVTEFLIPMEHGWNVYNGEVVDFTAHHNKIKVREYFGVHIPENFLNKKLAETGMSDSYLQHYFYEKIYKDNLKYYD